MAYTKTTWVDGASPAINAANLNKVEEGIYDAHRLASSAIVVDPGATDHTKAIQGALDIALARGEAEVWIPARADGAPWTISRVMASGTGTQRLTVRAWGQIRSSLANTNEAKHIFYVDNLERFHAEGLDIYYTGPVDTGGSYTGTHDNLRVQNCGSVKLVRCRGMYATYAGIMVKTCTDVDVIGCEGHYNRVEGLGLYDGNRHISVIGGKYSFNGLDSDMGTGYGVAVHQFAEGSESQQVLVMGVVSHDNFRKGIDAHAGRRISFIDNISYGNKLYGMFCGAQTGGFVIEKILIKGNQIHDTTYRETAYTVAKFGMQLGARGTSRCDHIVIEDNLITNVSDFGIYVSTAGAKTVKVRGNTLDLVSGESGSSYGLGLVVGAEGEPLAVDVSANTVRRTRYRAISIDKARHATVAENIVSQTEDAWAASTAKLKSGEVVPTTPNGYVYEASTGGTTGTTEPTWPTVVGQTVVDGGVTWKCANHRAAEGIHLAGTTGVFSAIVKDNAARGSFSGTVFNVATATSRIIRNNLSNGTDAHP